MHAARVGLLVACLLALATPSRGQTAAPPAPARDDIVNALNKFDTAPELDIPALKQAISERSKVRSKKEPEANKRPPVVPDIMNLPATFNVAMLE